MAVGDSVRIRYGSGDTQAPYELSLDSAEVVNGTGEVTVTFTALDPDDAVFLPSPTVTVDVVQVGEESVTFPGTGFGQSNTETVTIPNTPEGAAFDLEVDDFGTFTSDVTVTEGLLPLIGSFGETAPEPEPDPDPDPEPAPEPTPSPDPEDFTIPFSVLNAAPWVEGVEDVILTVPQVGDIEDIVDDAVPDLFEIGDEVERQLALFDFPEPPSLIDIRQEVEEELDQLVIPELDDIRVVVENALAELDIPEPPDLDEIVDGVTEEIDSLIDDVQAAVSDVERGIDQTIASVDRELTAQLSALEQQIDETIAPLGETVDEIQDAVDDIPDEIQGLLDRVDELPGEVAEAVREEIEPEINDVGLFGDPIGFAGQFLVEGLERAVSEETAERLSERADD